MSRFDRYLLSQLLALFGFFSLILVSIYWVNQAVSLFEQLISDGQTAWVFLELSALTLPNVIRLVLPVAAFIGVIYATNRLSADSEMVVMQSTGFSPWRMVRPALAFGLIVAVLLSVLSHVLVPVSRGEMASRRAAIAENVTAQFLTEGTFQHPASGLTLYIREITPTGELRDLFLSDARAANSRTTYTSERAFLVRDTGGPKLVMFSGMAQTYSTQTHRLAVTRFDDFTYDIGALLNGGGTRRPDLRELSTPRLLAATPADLERTGESPEDFLAEAHARISQPLTAAVMAVIGFAAMLTGGFSRFGNWPQIVLAVVLIVVVQVVANLGGQMAQRGDWPASYLPVLVGGLIACGLLWSAARPRRIRQGKPGPEVAA